MTTEQLKTMGQLLYGDSWQSQLARELDVNPRRISQWLAGDRPLRDWVYDEMLVLLIAKRDSINDYLLDV